MSYRSLTLLLLVCAGCATTDPVVPEGPRVLSLSLEGNDAVADGEVKERILTTEPPWFKRLFPWLPFGEEPRFDRNAWRSDLRRIPRYYQARGYYQAEVIEEEILTADGDPLARRRELPDAVRLRVRVEEGAPTVVETLAVRGLDDLPGDLRRRLLRRLPMRQGDIFDEGSWDALKSNLEARLREEGYAEASVLGEALVDVTTQRAELNVEVDTGRRYTFGRIFVSNAPDALVAPSRIIDQARNAIDEGDVYSESALADAQAKVQMMGVFGGVRVNRGLVNREAGTIPVVIEVREAPFHSVRTGAGVGVEAFRTEVRILGEYTDRNFFGGLRRLTLTGKAGYAWAANGIDSIFNSAISLSGVPHGVIFDLNAQVEQPRIFFQDVSGQLSLGIERGVEPAYTHLGGTVGLGFTWRPSANFTFRPSVVFEGYRIDGTPGLTGLGAIGTPGASNLALGCPTGALQCFVPLNYLEQVIEYDRRDNPISPTAGYYLSVSFQQGGGPLSDFAFLRVMPEARGYLTPFRDTPVTFAMRVRAGSLMTYATEGNPAAVSPIVSRFFAGGPSSMRGFSSGRLSPLQLVLDAQPGQQLPPPETEPPTDEETLRRRTLVPLGGNGLLDTSLEARWRVGSTNLHMATFIDAGLVTQQSFGRVGEGCDDQGQNCTRTQTSILEYLRGNLLTAVGLGARYHTPVGPIRLDLAYRLPMGPPLPVNSGEYHYNYDTSCFGFGRNRTGTGTPPTGYGGAPEGRCVIHISIGEAF